MYDIYLSEYHFVKDIFNLEDLIYFEEIMEPIIDIVK